MATLSPGAEIASDDVRPHTRAHADGKGDGLLRNHQATVAKANADLVDGQVAKDGALLQNRPALLSRLRPHTRAPPVVGCHATHPVDDDPRHLPEGGHAGAIQRHRLHGIFIEQLVDIGLQRRPDGADSDGDLLGAC